MENSLGYNLLRTQPFFSRLSDEELHNVLAKMLLKKVKKYEDFYYSATQTERVYLLVKGMAKKMLNKDGNEIISEVLQENDFFGCLFFETPKAGDNQKKENQFIRSMGIEVLILSWTVADFESMLIQNTALAILYTKKAGEKLKLLETRFADLVHKDVKTRLLTFLKNFALRYGKKEHNRVITPYIFTQQDIAGLIGASRQTVATLMKEFQTQHQLHYTRSTLTFYF